MKIHINKYRVEKPGFAMIPDKNPHIKIMPIYSIKEFVKYLNSYGNPTTIEGIEYGIRKCYPMCIKNYYEMRYAKKVVEDQQNGEFAMVVDEQKGKATILNTVFAKMFFGQKIEKLVELLSNK